jgi:hypothetical protein
MEATKNMEARKRNAKDLAIAAIDSIEKRPAKVTKKLAAVVELWVEWNHLYEKRCWKRAGGTVDDDWFYYHFHPNTWVNYGGSGHDACLDGDWLYADNRYCSCQEKSEHFEAWEAFDYFEKGSVRFTYQDKDLFSVTHRDLFSVTHRLKLGRSFSEEDDDDMIDLCHPRDLKADEEEEAAMAEDWREKMRKRRERATKDADRLWVFSGMQDA